MRTLTALCCFLVLVSSSLLAQPDRVREGGRRPGETTEQETPTPPPAEKPRGYGQIKGLVLDISTQEPLVGAVVITNTKRGAYTDENGEFVINEIPAGTYELYFQLLGYKADTLPGVSVVPGQAAAITLKMLPDDYEVEAVEIVSTRAEVESSNLSLVSSIKLSENVVVGISKEQITRSQDRTTADVIRRIPGVSLANNRFVMVRGLPPRYSQVLLNKALTPSAEADIRSFSFDIIPSGMVEEILVTKTPSPDLPGDFAGGIVSIKSLDIPARNILSVSYQTSYRENTSFRGTFRMDQTEALDPLGAGANARALPNSLPPDLSDISVSQSDRAQAGRDLPNNWAPRDASAPLDQRFNLLFARKLNTKGSLKVATTTALRYSYTNQFFNADRLNYSAFDEATGTQDTFFNYNDNQYERTYRIGVLHNWNLKFNERHTLRFNSLFNQFGQNQVIERQGVLPLVGLEVQNTAIRYRQRRLFAANLQGDHRFLDRKLKLEWVAGGGLSSSDEPDFRQMTYNRDRGSSDPFAFQPDGNLESGGRFYSEMDENTVSAQAKVTYTFREKDGLKAPIELFGGVFWERRRRDFAARLFSVDPNSNVAGIATEPIGEIFAPQNFDESALFLTEITNPSDAYDASNDLYAGFVGATVPLGNKVSLTGGIRIEYNDQRLNSFLLSGQEVNIVNDILSPLPSLNLTYRASEKIQVRAGGGMTVNRPEFREIAPFFYLDVFQNILLEGTDTLNTPRIYNGDLRFEYYPNPGELIAVGAFYKYFDDPIQWFFVPGVSSGGTRKYKFGNALSAQAIGAEVEIRKSFGSFTRLPVLKDLGVILNAAYIFTEVQLLETGASASEDINRPLQDQSPFIVNATLNYDLPQHGFLASLTYNVFGRRLNVIGTAGFPDIYEMPRHTLDLTLSKQFGKYITLKAGIQNLVDARYLLRLDRDVSGSIEDTDPIIEDYRLGRYYSLGVSFTLQ